MVLLDTYNINEWGFKCCYVMRGLAIMVKAKALIFLCKNMLGEMETTHLMKCVYYYIKTCDNMHLKCHENLFANYQEAHKWLELESLSYFICKAFSETQIDIKISNNNLIKLTNCLYFHQ